jgi:HPt (histidine-containing phosphotransfer) domain-containing protein
MIPANSNSAGVRAVAAEAAAGADVISLARIDRLRRSMPGKESVVGEMIDLFVADLPARLGAIRGAIDSADARGLALQAHALRGSAANFGAARLDDLCGKLEELGAGGALAGAPAMLDALAAESARVRDALLALRS